MTDVVLARTTDFLRGLAAMPWLRHTGEPYESALVVPDVMTAWDSWSDEMMATWEPRTLALEKKASEVLGDDGIDTVFEQTSLTIEEPVQTALAAYFARRPEADPELLPEIFESITRDVAWAVVESLLDSPGFFTALLAYYKAGRWPCAWEGEYPKGRIVLL